MDVIDYYGPRVAKCKLSKTDNEALYKMCLEATEPFNSKLLGNIREQNTITNALKNTNVFDTISNHMENYLKNIDAGMWGSVVNSNEIKYIGEVNKFKFNKFTPGSKIKIISEHKLKKMKPDYLLVLPWHFKDNIIKKEKAFLNSGGKLLFPLPDIEII